MISAQRPVDGASPLSPAEIADALPSRPVLSSSGKGWKRITLQRWQSGTAQVSFPGFRDHVLTLQLGGPTLVDNKLEGGRRERYWCEKGQVNLLPAGHPVSQEMKGSSDVLLIHLAPELVAEVAEEVFDRDPALVSLRRFAAMEDARLRDFFLLFLIEAKLGGSGAALMVESLGRAFALQLLRQHSNLSRHANERAATVPVGRLRRIIEFMREHLDQPLSLAQLAALTELSQSQFARAFRNATGQPPHRYLIGLRIESAKELLKHTDLSVIEIGLRCGFEYPSHFATTFQKAVGTTPRNWRVVCRS